MKKRYLILAGLLALTVAAAGCGKDKEEKPVQQAEVTPTATPVPETGTDDLVNMEVTKEEKNVIGEKSTSASKVTIINKTGDEVGAIYIRKHPSDEEEDDDWGEELIQGAFTLKNGEQAVYYYAKPSSAGITYDVRITYTDEDKNECFFRDLPLAAMKELTLRMSGTGEESIPYATYMTGSGKKQVSTLEDVKKRLGITDEDESEEEDTDNDSQEETTPQPTAAPEPTAAPQPTTAPGPDYDESDDTTPTDDTIDTAKGYIGQSMNDLIGQLGSPQYDEYEEEPDTGKTGYHYYQNFTVSTTVDENGNEIVTGIW